MKVIFNKTFLFLSIIALVALVGCRKKKDTIATITVVNKISGASVENAKVVLYATSTTGHQAAVTVHDTAYANGNGIAYFNYNDVYQLGQAGVCVLNIKATKDNLSGEGIIKIEEEKTTNANVFLQ
ncbi:MAG: hypothetical protein LW701_00875 [Fluviicola sp.]|jgi:hypothetical protein|nr:hypothetical protein [Fluviicola sp.]